MADEIIHRDAKILSLDEARAEATRKVAEKDPELIGAAGLKRNASKEFVLETATLVAMGACERTYHLIAEQQAEGLAKVEAMCLQHVEQLRAEIEARTLAGRWRRFRAWLWPSSAPALTVSEPEESAP